MQNRECIVFEVTRDTDQRIHEPCACLWVASLRSADVFPVVASLPPKNNVCEPEQQNDFRDLKAFVLMLANQIKG